MAVALTNKGSGASTTNGGGTVSVTPSANVPLLMAVGVSAAAATHTDDSIAIAGCNLTWTLLGRVAVWGSRRGTYLFKGVGASPSTGSPTITFTPAGASTYESHKWSLDEVTGADGTTPFGTVYTYTSGSATSAPVTVSETPDAGDMVFYAAGQETNEACSLGGELDTTLAQFGDATGVRRFITAYDSSPDSTPVPSVTWATTASTGAIALIVNVAAGGGATTVVSAPVQVVVPTQLETRSASVVVIVV